MEATVQFDIRKLRAMYDKAQTIEEIRQLNSLIPELTDEQKLFARKNMDDGIYDKNGVLIGENHPDD